MKDRDIIFNKTNGKCYYCGVTLSQVWHADHVKPVDRHPSSGRMDKPENDNIDNMVPACPRCNNWKHSMSVDQFRFTIQNLITGLNRDSSQYRMAKDYGLIKETGKVVKFFHENGEPLYDSILDDYEKVILKKVISFCIDFEKHHSPRQALKNIIKKLQL